MSEDPIDTGFGSWQQRPVPAAAPVSSPSVQGVIPKDIGTVISSVQEAFPQNGPTPEEVKAAARAAAEQRQREQEVQERDAKKAAFLAKVAEARKQAEPKPHVPQPVAPRIMAQTEAEMAEGARMNGIHAERIAAGPIPPRPEKTEGYTTPVFRPGDHVPNMDQGKNGTPEGGHRIV